VDGPAVRLGKFVDYRPDDTRIGSYFALPDYRIGFSADGGDSVGGMGEGICFGTEEEGLMPSLSGGRFIGVMEYCFHCLKILNHFKIPGKFSLQAR
jgi:hypothetical protein